MCIGHTYIRYKSFMNIITEKLIHQYFKTDYFKIRCKANRCKKINTEIFNGVEYKIEILRLLYMVYTQHTTHFYL